MAPFLPQPCLLLKCPSPSCRKNQRPLHLFRHRWPNQRGPIDVDAFSTTVLEPGSRVSTYEHSEATTGLQTNLICVTSRSRLTHQSFRSLAPSASATLKTMAPRLSLLDLESDTSELSLKISYLGFSRGFDVKIWSWSSG